MYDRPSSNHLFRRVLRTCTLFLLAVLLSSAGTTRQEANAQFSEIGWRPAFASRSLTEPMNGG